jgi:hypothetical protein|tara:strand:+ start:23785 stop:23991 length:207 start_codon:yes stop_codon:yes gene_type:complete
MAIYRHDNLILDLSGPSNAKAKVYRDGMLLFQGQSGYAVPLFVKECNDKDVTFKFYSQTTRQNLTNGL